MRAVTCLFLQHSPSNHAQPELDCKMFEFHEQQCFSKSISYHVVHGAVHKVQDSLLDDPVDETKMDVNVFCASMVLVVLSQHNG